MTASTRHTTLRRRLATVLVSVALGSVLLLGMVNYYEAQALLSQEVGVSLSVRGDAIAMEIGSALDGIQNTAAALAGGPMLGDDLEAFTTAFRDLDTAEVSTATRSRLERFYEESVLGGPGSPSLDTVMPATEQGVLLQSEYLLGEPSDSEIDLGTYGDVYADRNDRLQQVASTLGFSSLLLIDGDANVVYASTPDVVLGTNLLTGPHRNAGLALVVTERLAAAPRGDAVFTDFESLISDVDHPSMYAVVSLRHSGEFAGALALEIPIEALNALTTSRNRWQDIGLGSTGEVYIVGPDGLMRSESRRWIESADDYLGELEANGENDLAGRIARLGTTVLAQPVESSLIDAALDGRSARGRTVDYLGRHSLAYTTPIEFEGLGWVAVAEVSASEADAPLRDFRTRLLITAAVLLPIAGMIGVFIADRITRPIGRIVDAARTIASGDLDAELPELGANEFGDVSRRLRDMVRHLRGQQHQLEAEEAEITRMLHAALPPRLVTRLREGDRQIVDLVDTATVISITVAGAFDQPGVDPEVAVDVGTRISEALERSAANLGVERVRSSSSDHIFATGLDESGASPDAAVEFVLSARDAARAAGAADAIETDIRAGLAAGRVVSWLMTGNQLSYGLFGEPVQLASTLNAAAADGEILVHDSVVATMGDRWLVEPADRLVDLAGDDLAASRLLGSAVDADTSS